jgi:hypothetical protein
MDNGNISAQQAIEFLLRENPRGFSINASGFLTPAPDALELTSFDQFREIVREPKELTLPLAAGQMVKLKVQAIDANKAKQIEAMRSEVGPPPKRTVKPAGPGKAAVEEDNLEDPAYREKMQANYYLRRTATIEAGLVGLPIPGDSIEQKNQYLASMFPPRVLEAIYAAILALTSDPIETASFS